MPLDRAAVDRNAGRQIADLQLTRHVSDDEKRRIRKMHEDAVRKVESKARRK